MPRPQPKNTAQLPSATDLPLNAILSRLVKNSAYLLSGNTLADLCTMAALALTARKLGPEIFGTFVLIQTYAFIISQLLNFQSWQALIKFGAEKLEHQNGAEFVDLISLCYFLDFAVAILATALALLLINTVAAWYGWNEVTATMASAYSLTILFSVTDTSIGILQIFNKFKLLAAQNIAVSLSKLVLVLGAFFLNGGVWSFIAIWMGCGAFSAILLLTMGWRVLSRKFDHPVRPLASLQPALADNQGLLGFLTTTNLHSSIRLASRELDVMIIGAFLGPASAGMLKIVKQIASLFTRIASPLYNAIYPEFASLWAAQEIDRITALVVRSFFIAFVPSIIFWLGLVAFGKPAIIFFLGASYAPLFVTAVVYNLAVLIAVITFSFHPLMLTLGKASQSLLILTLSTAAYFLLLVLLLKSMDMLGVAISYLLFYIIWSALMGLSIHYYLGRARLAISKKHREP